MRVRGPSRAPVCPGLGWRLLLREIELPLLVVLDCKGIRGGWGWLPCVRWSLF